jgi:hypothetical protein
MRGAGFLAIWSDVEPKALTDYRHWLTREHTTERVTTKGFLAVRVFRANRSDIDRFFILYELEAPEVLDGSDYMARLNAPTPWTLASGKHFRNVSRSLCLVAGRPRRDPQLPRCVHSICPKRRKAGRRRSSRSTGLRWCRSRF